MAQALNQLAALGDYLGGQFVRVSEGRQDGLIERQSPRDARDLVARVPFRFQAADEAVAHARAAFRGWALTPLEERKQPLLRLRAVLARRAEELAWVITREVGKPLWEARSELSAALHKIDITLGDGLALVAPRQVAPGQQYAFRPHGVGVVLGPFNFPLHLVHGHVVPLLVLGNTVIIKPSELTPMVGQLYAECLHEAGFPPGVVGMVQGGREQGARLSTHPDVDAVMLTGSYAAGQAIKRATLEQPHKLLALELGGRNPAIVLADAPLEKAVHDVAWGAFVTTGQRCSGTAVALVARELADAFVAGLQRQLAALRVGDPLEPDVFMGPLVSTQARDGYQRALAQAEREGVELLCAPALPQGLPEGAYLPPSLHRLHAPSGLAYEQEELFGPDLCIEVVDGLEQAIQRANESPYGLATSVFTQSQSAFEQAYLELRFGCVNHNAPTCGASSRLPFGGTRKSGNHRPAALFSTLYASYPVASLSGGSTLDPAALSPGLGRP